MKPSFRHCPVVDVRPRFVGSVARVEITENALLITGASERTAELAIPSVAVRQSLASLAAGGTTEGMLADDVRAQEGVESEAQLYYFLDLLRRNSLLQYDWLYDGDVCATLQPTTLGFNLPTALSSTKQQSYQLSRFAYLRRESDHLVLECPDASCRLIAISPLVAFWLASFGHRDIVPFNGAHQLGELLLSLGFLEPSGGIDRLERSTWEFHDRLFHFRSRAGLGSNPAGASYRFVGKFPSPPAIKARMTDDRIVLDPPPPEGPSSETLVSIMERRRSVRKENEAQPITLSQLSCVLYRIARIKELRPGANQELIFRTFPSGGAIHELEFYVAIRECAGVDKGLYHYCGTEHALYRLCASPITVSCFFDNAAKAMDQPARPPQTLIILASRLPRLAWKYEGIAYRVSLLNAGVALANLYLIATAMNLSCSAIGNGDSGLFAQATGVSPVVETSIAEFALGSRGA